MSVEKEMPKYKCHKEVWALKIKSIITDGQGEDRESDGSAIIIPEDGYAHFKVDYQYMGKHKPQVGGYYVVYKGGYSSYSPAKEFEEGYTLIKETTFKDRLIQEKNELDEKISKLTVFLNSDKFYDIPNKQQFLLKNQLEVMQTYSKILSERQ